MSLIEKSAAYKLLDETIKNDFLGEIVTFFAARNMFPVALDLNDGIIMTSDFLGHPTSYERPELATSEGLYGGTEDDEETGADRYSHNRSWASMDAKDLSKWAALVANEAEAVPV